MSWTYFCHNVPIARRCLAWEPSVSTLQMTTLRSSVRGSDFNTAVSQQAGLNGCIAVIDDMLFHNSPSVNTLLSVGELYFSDDFGSNWATVTKPVDTNYEDISPATFASRYPGEFGWGPSFRVIGDVIYTMLRDGEKMSVWSTLDGSSWSMVTSTYVVTSPGVETYYAGEFLKVGDGAYQIGEISGSPYIFGKWAWSGGAKYSTLQIGSWVANEAPSEWYNTLDNNIVNIGDTGYGSVAVGRMVYQYAASPSSGLQLIDLDVYDGAHKVSSATWNGVNSWTYSTSGSWLESNGLNSPFASLSPAADGYQYSGDHEVASIPLTGNNTTSSANWGKWYIFTGSSVETVDFSTEMARESGVDHATNAGKAGALKYIPALGAWILTWYYPAASGQSRALNMRMCTRDGDVWSWSDKVRYVLPTSFSNISNRIQIEYSVSQGKFVFGGQFSTPTPYVVIAEADNVFTCALYGN